MARGLILLIHAHGGGDKRKPAAKTPFSLVILLMGSTGGAGATGLS